MFRFRTDAQAVQQSESVHCAVIYTVVVGIFAFLLSMMSASLQPSGTWGTEKALGSLMVFRSSPTIKGVRARDFENTARTMTSSSIGLSSSLSVSTGDSSSGA